MSWNVTNRLRGRGSPRANRARRRPGPRRVLEALEGRTLLSLVVTNLDDDHADLLIAGSLRAAVFEAPPGETIEFDPSLAGGTIALDEVISIDKDLQIVGLGRDQLTITASAEFQSRLFSIVDATVTLSGLTMTGGYDGEGGGAIYHAGGSLTILDSTLTGNRAGDVGFISSGAEPPDVRGGAIWNHDGALTLIDSDLTWNHALGWSYETVSMWFGDYLPFAGRDARGGAIYSSSGSVLLHGCTVDGNEAIGGNSYAYDEYTVSGGSAWGGALYSTGGPVTVSGSRFAGNQARGGVGSTSEYAYLQTPGGDGGDARGGGLYVQGDRLELLDSAIEANRAYGGQGGDGRGVREYDGEYFHNGSGGRGGSAQGGGVFGQLVILSESRIQSNTASGGNGGAGTSIDSFYRDVEGGRGGDGGAAEGGGICGLVHARESIVEGNGVSGGHGGPGGAGFDIDDPDGDGSDLDGTPGVDGVASHPDTRGPVVPILEAASQAVDDGTAQRSNIASYTLTFNQGTVLPSLIESGAIVDAVRIVDVATETAIPLAASRYRYDAPSFTLTIDLTADGFGGSPATMLADGRYQLRLDTAAITGAGDPSNALWDDDGMRDATLRRDFHRLEGDFDGDAVVSLADRSILMARVGARVGQPTYAVSCDLNGDGVISLADYLLWTRRIGRRV